jgi:hypothetical protein
MTRPFLLLVIPAPPRHSRVDGNLVPLNGIIFDWIPDQAGDDALPVIPALSLRHSHSLPPRYSRPLLPPSFPCRRESSAA